MYLCIVFRRIGGSKVCKDFKDSKVFKVCKDCKDMPRSRYLQIY